MVTVLGWPYNHSKDKETQMIWPSIPSNLLALALKILGDATKTHGSPVISWSKHAQHLPDKPKCMMPIICCS